MSAVKRLAAYKMALDAVPEGTRTLSIAAIEVIEYLLDPKRIEASAAQAEAWARERIRAMRVSSSTGVPNPWANATDEEIAEEILRRIKRGDP